MQLEMFSSKVLDLLENPAKMQMNTPRRPFSTGTKLTKTHPVLVDLFLLPLASSNSAP